MTLQTVEGEVSVSLIIHSDSRIISNNSVNSERLILILMNMPEM